MKLATATILSFVVLGLLGWQWQGTRALSTEFSVLRELLDGLEERLSPSPTAPGARSAEVEQSETTFAPAGSPPPPSGLAGQERHDEGDSTAPPRTDSPAHAEARLDRAVEKALERYELKRVRERIHGRKKSALDSLEHEVFHHVWKTLSEGEQGRVREVFVDYYDQIAARLPLPMEERKREWNRLHSLLCDDLRDAFEEEAFQGFLASKLRYAKHCQHE
jgi:hypothetical protein